MDTEKTLQWLAATAEKALTEARAGNAAMLNRLGQNVALQHYINNVATRQVMTPFAWSQQYYPYMQEADRLREEYDKLQEAVAVAPAVKDLQTKLDALYTMVQGLVEAQQKLPNASLKKLTKALADVGLTPDYSTPDPAPEAETPAEEA